MKLVEQEEEGYKLTTAGNEVLWTYESTRKIVDVELLSVIAASNRLEILRELSKRPAWKSELSNSGASRSSTAVGRSLRTFESHKIVVRNNSGKYQLTPHGREVLDAFETLIDVAEQAIEKEAFFKQFGKIGSDFPSEALTSAELVTVTDPNPYAVLGRAVELVENREESISRVRGLTPVFTPYVSRLFEDAISDTASIRVVLSETALEGARQPRNLESFTRRLIRSRIGLRLYPERVSYGIGLFDDQLLLVGYDDPEENEVAVITDDERLVEWAESRFQQYWAGANLPSEDFKQSMERLVNKQTSI